MFQIERLQKIKQILSQKKTVSVTELSEKMNVSEITIRRDFEKLEQDGFLTRTHGGAVLNAQALPTRADISVSKNLEPFALSGNSIGLGQICSDIVDDYDVIFLTRCPSNLVLADNLKEKSEIVVVTNYLDVVRVMEKSTGNKVILLGGEVDYDRMATKRSSFTVSAEQLKIGKAFVHVQGIDFQGGLTVNDYEDKLIYDVLKQTSAEIIIVAEGMFFGRTGLIQIDTIEHMTTLVTDDHIPYDYKISLFHSGVKLYQKFNLE